MKTRIIFLFLVLMQLANSQAQNQNISNGLFFDGEPYLAVNPNNHQHMVVAWMGFVFQNKIMIKTRVSIDGGENWSPAQNIFHVNNAYTSADPSLAFDNSGNVYLSYIDYDPSFSSGAVYVRKSTDGGFNWGDAVVTIAYDSDPGRYPIDRPWINIDRSGGPFDGYIYITTMNAKAAGPPPYHPYFAKSINQGESFEPWRYIDTTGWLSGPFISKPMPSPSVAANGTFHCVYPSWVLSQNILPQFILATTTDGGNSFTHQTVFASSGSIAVTDTSAKKGYLLRANPANPEHLAFLYLSSENGDADVLFRETLNSGETWSESLRINDDPIGNGRMQDLVWAAFDTDGDLAVAWRDRRNSADTGYAASYEIYGATRLKDSQLFSTNFRFSEAPIPFDDVLFGNGNDFMCIALFNDTISAVWGDTRNGKLNIWFQKSELNGTLLSVKNLAGEKIPEVKINKSGSDEIEICADGITGISIYDMNGREVYSVKVAERQLAVINTAGIKSGAYLLRVLTRQGRISAKVIL